MEEETSNLFPELPGGKVKREDKVVTRETARVLWPNRDQIELRASDLESLLPEGHRARLVWAYVGFGEQWNKYGKIPITVQLLLSIPTPRAGQAFLKKQGAVWHAEGGRWAATWGTR